MPIVRQPVPDMEKETIMTDAYERAKLDDEAWEREHDSREKLERDIRFGSTMTMYSNSDETEVTAKWSDVLGWLDRQAAITRRETRQNWQDAPNVLDRTNMQTIAELQSKVDELQAETDEWRELYGEMSHERCDAIMREDELQAELDAYDQTHMLLPVDADGVPIKIGDKIQQLNHAGVWTNAMPVIAVDDHGCFALAHGIACDARTYVWGNNCRHVKQCTVEDVLVDMLEAAVGYNDAHTTVALSAVEKYADEIRELMGVCDE